MAKNRYRAAEHSIETSSGTALDPEPEELSGQRGYRMAQRGMR